VPNCHVTKCSGWSSPPCLPAVWIVCRQCAATCNRLQIAATIDPTHSCRQREYLGSCRAPTLESAYSAYWGDEFDRFLRGSNFFDGVTGAMHGHVAVEFLTNESCFRGV
jgi:hypothetical protein